MDIGAAHMASLDGLDFEGATKRNRPNLKVRKLISQFVCFVLSIFTCAATGQLGNLQYAQVSLAHKDMEPELECLDARTRKAGEFGELKGGLLTRCSLQMCRQ